MGRFFAHTFFKGRGFIVPLALMLTVVSVRSTANEIDSKVIRELRQEIVRDWRSTGDVLPPSFRERVQALVGKPFHPSSVRALLLWWHESGGEALLTVDYERMSGGIRLLVDVKARPKITSISFEGNFTVVTNVLLPQINIREGMDYESAAISDAEQKISAFYGRQGYLATAIQTRFDTSTGALIFSIKEGEPTLISSLKITPIETIERLDLRQRFESDLQEKFGLKVGDRLQRDRVMEGLQAIKDWLRFHDFLLARDPAPEYRVGEDGQVSVLININYGPRIRYGFRGNHQFSYRELMGLVGEIKEVSAGMDYLAAVRRRVLDAYKDIGLSNAKISSLVRDDPSRGIRWVTLAIDEGEKIGIESIVIDGVVSMGAKEAIGLFKSLAPRLVQRDYYHEAGITRAAELFVEQLQSRGFLSARLEFIRPEFSEDRKKVKILVLYNEGLQTKVGGVLYSGLKSIPEEEVNTMLGLKQGDPFNIFSFERGLVELKEKYKELGHLSMQIANEGAADFVSYSRDSSQVDLNISLEEGPVYQVGEIFVRGNKQTHARVVTRELPFVASDVLTSSLLSEAEDNIRQLNLFDQVTVSPVDRPGFENVKDILIFVEEGQPGSFDIVPGFRNDLGLRLGFELGYQNLGGWNRSVTARAVVNRRLELYRFPEYNFFLGFREPYIANTRIAFNSGLSLFRRQFLGFDARVNRVTLGLNRQLTRYLSGFLEYGFEQIRISNVRPPYFASDEKTSLIGTLTPGVIVDMRNDRFNPSRGLYSVTRFEVASRFWGSQEEIGYYRATTFNTFYIPFLDGPVLALAANFGWQRSNLAGRPIPTYKLFRLGGLGSIRGYREDGIEVGTTKELLGTLGLVNYRAEARVPLIGSFGAALFLDAGNLLVDRPISFAPAELRTTVGTGLRYQTPVGPVVLDFAWRLQSDERIGDTRVGGDNQAQRDVDRFRIHFSIGAF
jgi:outer membrane protein insertion porin family